MKYNFISFLNDLADFKYEGAGKLKEILKNRDSRWRFLLLFVSVFLILTLITRSLISFSQAIGPLTDTYNDYIIEFTEKEKARFVKKAINLNRIKDFYVIKHKIILKENFWGIAKRYGIDIDTIFGANPYLKSMYAYKDQEILIPNKRGCFHIVRKGETIKTIADLYRRNPGEIKKANRFGFATLGWFKKVKPGMIIFIPEAIPIMISQEMSKYYRMKKMFISPASGRYTSGFGWRTHPLTKKRQFHKGLDIKCKYGAPVCAAAGGVVIYSGWAGGYGKIVKIDHGKGYVTCYAHCLRLHVRAGQRVKQGQIIARGGRSGKTTGTHLHFEVRKKGKPVNPAVYLW